MNTDSNPSSATVAKASARAPFDFAKWWDRVGILMVLVALVILMSAIAPNFNRIDNLLQGGIIDC